MLQRPTSAVSPQQSAFSRNVQTAVPHRTRAVVCQTTNLCWLNADC